MAPRKKVDHGATPDRIKALFAYLKDYEGDILEFVRDILKQTPNRWQEEFLQEAKDRPRVAVKSGHSVGKSTVIAWLVIYLLVFSTDLKIIITGASFDNLQAGLFAEIRKLISENKVLSVLLEAQSGIIKHKFFPDHVFAVLRTASKDNPAALQGVRGKRTSIIIDEASGIPQVCFDAVESILADPNTQLIMVGNPLHADGPFFQAFEELSDVYYTMTVSSLDYQLHGPQDPRTGAYTALNPNDPNERVSPQWIETKRRTETASMFEARVLGEFPKDDESVLVTFEQFQTAVGNRDVVPSSIDQRFWGLDVATTGADKTVLVKRYGPVIEQIKIIPNANAEDLQILMMNEYSHARQVNEEPFKIFVDGTGNGGPIYDWLRYNNLPVHKVVFNNASEVDTERFENLRAQMYWNLANMFKRYEIALNSSIDLPTLEMLRQELSAHEVTLNMRGRILMIPKDKIKKKIKRSPDLSDAVALAFRADWKKEQKRMPWEEEEDVAWVL